MKIVVSPAKSLDQKSKLPTNRGTQPKFLEEAQQINRKLSRFSKNEIKELMGISDKLTELNYERYQEFEEEHTKQNSRPAAYLFAGDVYTGLDAYNIPEEKIDFMQDTLRMLSGMYGILRPLDLIQPYRLEMGTKLPLGRKDDLYEFWQEKITEELKNEMKKNEVLINLASQEYFNAIDTEKLDRKIVSPVFKDFKNGKLKIISFYAKKARGSMSRYIIDKKITDWNDLKGFDYDGYSYSEKYTEQEEEPVFVR